MTACATCQRPLPEDPNELENILECRYCGALLCSEACATDHEQEAHPDEALPSDEDEQQR